ncbi:hypothetical protein QMP26_05605 [Enterocloster clostridioformis]|nr:hypothetical protein [uncultured Anaerostipes sp.]
MEYFDEKILELDWEKERQKHTTLQSGIYVGDDLVTFSRVQYPNSKIYLFLPDPFIKMPDEVKNIKYPSKEAPEIIMTSLDSKVNIAFNLLPILMKEGDTQAMSSQFQLSLKNMNPSLVIKNPTTEETYNGNEVSWFDYKGYHLDGQSFNRIYILKMKKTVLHGIFNCPLREKDNWDNIINQIFMQVEEEI